MPKQPAKALCAHAIAEDDLLEVPDLTSDERFHDHLLANGEHKLRFYAGAPLRAPDGYVLGIICVMDQPTRTLTEKQRSALKGLAVLVMNLLEGRLAQSHALQLTSLLDQSDNEIYSFDGASCTPTQAHAAAPVTRSGNCLS